MPDTHPSGLSDAQITDLRSKATQAAHGAYAPYSHFRVGAAVLLDNGQIFTGANIENASYRLTLCAETTAVARAICEAGAGVRVVAVAVDNLNDSDSFPCGPCRQILLEFGTPGTWVFAPGPKGPADASLADLLPYGFRLETL